MTFWKVVWQKAVAGFGKAFSPDRINDGVGLVGAGLVAWGFHMAWAPLGYIIGGGFLLAWAVLASRTEIRGEE